MAVHALSLLVNQDSAALLISDRLATIVNTSPVVIRRILGQLKKAGLTKVRAATGAMFLWRASAIISLLDVYQAVEVVAEGKLFHVHDAPNPRCPVGRNI